MANTPNQPLRARCARTAGIVRGDATFRVLASAVSYFIMTMLIVAAVAVVPRSRVSLTAILIAFAVALATNLFRHESRSMLVNYLLRGGVGICNRADVGRWPSRVRPWTGKVSSDPERH